MFEPAVSTAQWGSVQLIDSTIIRHVVRMATELGIPVLPVHDEVITLVSAKLTIKLMLARAFQHVLKGTGDIRSVRMDWSVKDVEKKLWLFSREINNKKNAKLFFLIYATV